MSYFSRPDQTHHVNVSGRATGRISLHSSMNLLRFILRFLGSSPLVLSSTDRLPFPWSTSGKPRSATCQIGTDIFSSSVCLRILLSHSVYIFIPLILAIPSPLTNMGIVENYDLIHHTHYQVSRMIDEDTNSSSIVLYRPLYLHLASEGDDRAAGTRPSYNRYQETTQATRRYSGKPRSATCQIWTPPA